MRDAVMCSYSSAQVWITLYILLVSILAIHDSIQYFSVPNFIILWFRESYLTEKLAYTYLKKTIIFLTVACILNLKTYTKVQ